MNVANPHPPDALPKRKRTPYVDEEKLTQEQRDEIQFQKQKELGEAVMKQLKAKETKEKRENIQLRRGQPQVRDEMAEAVNARMDMASIPTRGNT